MTTTAALRKAHKTRVIHNHTPENVVVNESGGLRFSGGEVIDTVKIEYFYKGCGCPVESEPCDENTEKLPI